MHSLYWPALDRAGERMAHRVAARAPEHPGSRGAVARRWARRVRWLAVAGAVGGPAVEVPARGAMVWALCRAGAEFCRSGRVDPTDPAVLVELRREVYQAFCARPHASQAPIRLAGVAGRWLAPAARVWTWVEGGALLWDLYAASQERRRAEAALGRLEQWAASATWQAAGVPPAPG